MKKQGNIKVVLITNFCTHYRYKLFSLLAKNYNFDFCFFGRKEKSKEDVSHLTIIENNPKFKYLPAAEIVKELLKKKYDAIIKCTNNKWIFFASFIIAKLIKAKFIVWHSIWNYPQTLQYKLFSWLLIKILKDYSDAIAVYGEHGKNFLIEKGINPDKIFIAWQTVDNELYGRNVDNDETQILKEKLKISEDKKIILYVGRLVSLKGLEYLLEALNKLNKEDFILLLVGDGNLKSKIEEYCLARGIDYRITGFVTYNELPQFYKIATLLVLPSITTKAFKEPWGLVVNEAFNQGCPVVVTDAVGAGVGGLVRNGINGFVVPERNSQALADAISKIFDVKLRKFLSENALEEIKQWTYERQAQGFLDAVKYSFEKS